MDFIVIAPWEKIGANGKIVSQYTLCTGLVYRYCRY